MKKKALVFVIAGVFYLIGQYFRGYWWPYFTWPFPCHLITFGTTTYCNPVYLDTLGYPLITLGEFLAAIGVVLLFANERGFRAWLKFSLFYVPIATLLVLWIYPLHIGFFFEIGSTAGYDVGVSNAGELYLFATLIIVLWKRFKRSNFPQ